MTLTDDMVFISQARKKVANKLKFYTMAYETFPLIKKWPNLELLG